jgi:hypothetical protein
MLKTRSTILPALALAFALAGAAGAASSAGPLVASSRSAPPADASTGRVLGIGDKVPLPLQATPVKGRLPGFSERGVTYVLAFVHTSEASSRQAIPRLDALAQRFGRQLSVVAVSDEAELTVREFCERPEWAPKIGFVMAADPVRQAYRTFLGPRWVQPGPVAFVIRDGVVQWAGAPIDLDEVVTEVVAGKWSLDAAKRAAEQQRLWDRSMDDVDALARGGRADEALRKLDDACAIALPAQAAMCEGRRFTILLSAGRVADALACGERIVAKPANAKQPAGIAWSLMNAVPGDRGARDLALRAAQASDRTMRGRDAMVGAILARAYFLSDRRSDAAETARRALGFADSPDLQASLRDDIRVYEGTVGPGGQPAPKAPGTP